MSTNRGEGQNDNLPGNENDNLPGNENDNTGGNTNENDNTGGNTNTNDNTGDNTNQNDNTGGNTNENDNTGGNTNQNDNTGGNTNENDNTGGNTNTNDNTGGNTNQNDNTGQGCEFECPDGEVRLVASLTGTGSGDAEYRLEPDRERFDLSVSDTVPGVYQFTIGGEFAGIIVVDSGGDGDVDFDSNDGTIPPTFPQVCEGDEVVIGIALLSGTLEPDCS